MVELIFLGLTINIFYPNIPGGGSPMGPRWSPPPRHIFNLWGGLRGGGLKLCSPKKEGPAMCSFIHLSGPAACYAGCLYAAIFLAAHLTRAGPRQRSLSSVNLASRSVAVKFKHKWIKPLTNIIYYVYISSIC